MRTRRRHYKGSNQFRTRRRGDWRITLGLYVLFVLGFMAFATYYKNEGADAAYNDAIIISPLASGEETLQPTPFFRDERARRVYDFLIEKDSPLARHAELIVDQSDRHDIPWTLIVAISGKESSFGKAIKPGSHNAWGVMTWDKAGNRSIRVFDSWEDGIRFEAALLGNHYRTDMYGAIQERYCPSFECSDTWTKDVTHFSETIKKGGE